MKVLKKNIKKIYELPNKVLYCQKCVLSNQRPRTHFDKNGICNACKNQEYKNNISWENRKKQLKILLSKYRKKNGEFDIIVPSSGGKDSAIVAYKLKYEWGMNPLTVTWAPNIYTKIGWINFQNLIKSGLPNILASADGIVHRKLTRDSLIEIGDPFQPFIYGQVNFPSQIALQYNISLIMDGENGEEEYGGSINTSDDTFNLEEQKKYWFSSFPLNKWLRNGYTKKELTFYKSPDIKSMISNKIVRKFWSYYNYWDPQEHYYYANMKTEFRPNPEGRSEGTYSKYSSLDDKVDGFHYYFMLLKFGIGRTTSDACQEIRHGHLSRQEAIKLVEKYDTEFPKKHFKEFLDYCEISKKKFEDIANSWRNSNLWVKKKNVWKLRHTVGKKGVDD